MDYNVSILQLELTNKCNANCIFCKRDSKQGFMDIELFKKLILEFPEAKTVMPWFCGEPLLHPQFFKAMKFIKMNNKKINLFTNGSLLTKTKSKKLIKLGIDEIRFSVEGNDKESYEKCRVGLNWDKVLNNIEYFQSIKRGTKTVATITLLPENKNRINEIVSFWNQRVDEVVVMGEMPIGERKVDGEYKFKFCERPFNWLVVKWDGTVSFCCIDWFGKYSLGNARNGATDIWNSNKFNKLRERVNVDDNVLELCNICRSRFSSE
jgi:radical SAM protein with 4Fe4S-binding SPASM domain